MADRQRADWTSQQAIEFARKDGGIEQLEGLIALNESLPGNVREFPETILRMQQAIAQVRHENAAKAANEAQIQRAEDIEIASEQTNIARQSADAAVRSAVAAEESAKTGRRAADAAVSSADSAVRSAAAGEDAAKAAQASAEIARDTLKWSRLSALAAFGAFVVALIALFIAGGSSK